MLWCVCRTAAARCGAATRRLRHLTAAAPAGNTTAPAADAPDGVTVVKCDASARTALSAMRDLIERDPHRQFACDTEAVDIEVKEQSPVGAGRVICATVYAGGDVDFGNGPRLFIDNLDAAEGTLDRFRDFFQSDDYLKVWHNYGFDRHILYNHGIDCHGFSADTMHMARLWDASRTFSGGYSLEKLSEELIGNRKVPIKERFGHKKLKDGSLAKVPVMPDLALLQRNAETRDEWIDYATNDAEATWKLRRILEARLRAMPCTEGTTMFDFYNEYWRPFGEILTDMERAGIYVDRGYLSQIQQQAQGEAVTQYAVFLAWVAKQCPDGRFLNPKSKVQLQQLLYAPKGDERVFKTDNTDGYIEPGKTKPLKNRSFVISGMGLPCKARTATGLAQSDANALEKLAGSPLASPPVYGDAYDACGGGVAGHDACVAVDSVIKASSIEKLLNTYIVPLQEQTDSESRIHCSLNLNTETGRLSSRRPNLQNQPSLDKDVYRIRNAFAAPEGKALVVADYGQLELRILAHMARCRSMIDAFKAGGDFHSRTAMGMYDHIKAAVESGEVVLEKGAGVAPDAKLLKDVFGAERRQAKTLNFSIAYGKTASGLARDWRTSIADAKATLQRWYQDRPEVKAWQEFVIQRAKQTGYTRTLMGRYRKLELINSAVASHRGGAERAAINTPIQGGAADVVMKAMIEISRNERLRALGWRMLLQIHDEVIVEGPQESAQEALDLVRRCMEHPFSTPLCVDLVVDAKIVHTWYEAK